MTEFDIDELLGATGSRYFSLASPPDGDSQLLTISGVEQRTFTDTKKLVLTVAEDSRELILSQTNLKYLLTTLGRDPSAWKGERIVLSVGRSSYGSRMLRVNRPPVTASTAIQTASERIQ